MGETFCLMEALNELLHSFQRISSADYVKGI